MNLKNILQNNLYEELILVNFKYDNYKHDPSPRVKVHDFEYPGQKGQKTYGNREDVLGYNLNYFKNPKYASRAIDEIDSFARMLSANKLEKYKRLKYFFPEVYKHIRRYNKKYINKIKAKQGKNWKKSSYDTLKKQNQENF